MKRIMEMTGKAPGTEMSAGAFYKKHEGKTAKRLPAAALFAVLLLVLTFFQAFAAPVPEDASKPSRESAGPLAAETIYAADNANFVTDRFDVTVEAGKDHVFHVEEVVKVRFTKASHGLYRYIPFQPKYYDVKHARVEGWEYDTKREYTGSDKNGSYGNYIIRIGSEYEMVDGAQEYRISYDLIGTTDDSDKEDYLALDLFPTGWSTAVKKADLKLTMPEKPDWNKVTIYYGEYGKSTDLETADLASPPKVIKDGRTLEIKAADLPQGVGFTLSGTLPDGYWNKKPSRSLLKPLLYVIPVAVMLLMLFLWFFFGRDPRVVKPVEFYPPEGLTPAEVGYIIDGSLDNRDMSSMIMYMASKGYIKIREKKKGVFELIKANEVSDDEAAFVHRLYDGLFKGRKEKDGEIKVNLNNLPAHFSEDVKTASEQIKSEYDDGPKRMFKEASKNARLAGGILVILPLLLDLFLNEFINYYEVSLYMAAVPGVLSLIGLLLILSAYDGVHSNGRVKSMLKFLGGLFIMLIQFALLALIMGEEQAPGGVIALLGVSMLISLWAEIFMWARTEANAALFGKILGFRSFIEKAEYQRIKMLSEENPEYYYDVMPYAMVMGMSAKWAKAFEKLKIRQPDWYESYDGNMMWNSMLYYNMMNSCNSSFKTQSIVIDSSDAGGMFTGGGFSGGGFSGGGFGGGGGGSW